MAGTDWLGEGVIYQIFMPSFVLEHAVDSHSEVKE